MYKNIPKRFEFYERVGLLWPPDYEERELELFPSSLVGGFYPSRLREVLNLVNSNPEYHIVSCLQESVYVNGFVPDAMAYYLADGDPDPTIVHDPGQVIDVHYLYGKRNSTLIRLRA